MNKPIFSVPDEGDKTNMEEYFRTWEQNGVTLSAGIAPCCWMYNSPLQIIVKIGEWTGSFTGTEDLFVEGKFFADATPALLAEATDKGIPLVPCKKPGCTRMAFDPVAFKHVAAHGGRMGACEECFTAELRAKLNKGMEKDARKEERQDKRMLAKGYVWKIVGWVHPEQGGSDYAVVWYDPSPKKPTDETVQGWLKKKRSADVTDFIVTQLADIANPPPKALAA